MLLIIVEQVFWWQRLQKKMENENSDYVCLEYEINRKISKEDFENVDRVYNFLIDNTNLF